MENITSKELFKIRRVLTNGKSFSHDIITSRKLYAINTQISKRLLHQQIGGTNNDNFKEKDQTTQGCCS